MCKFDAELVPFNKNTGTLSSVAVDEPLRMVEEVATNRPTARRPEVSPVSELS